MRLSFPSFHTYLTAHDLRKASGRDVFARYESLLTTFELKCIYHPPLLVL